MISMRYCMAYGAALGMLAGCAPTSDAGHYIGYVEAEYVYLAAPEAGWIVEAPARAGDQAAPGEVLFRLDNTRQQALYDGAAASAAQAGAQAEDTKTGARPAEIEALKAQLAEAEAGLVYARAERDRWLPLVEEGNASEARGDQVRTNYATALARVNAAKEAIDVARLGGRDGQQQAASAAAQSAQAGLAEAQWRLSQRDVTAKVEARIEEVYFHQGDFAAAGAPLAALLPEGAVKIRFFVPQAELPSLSVGGTVSIRADGMAEPVTANISFIASEAEFTPPVIYSADARAKLVFLVEARPVDPAGLRPGLPVDVFAP